MSDHNRKVLDNYNNDNISTNEYDKNEGVNAPAETETSLF